MNSKAEASLQQIAPGALLRRAREGRKLSIEDVAQSLRLSPRIISALEEEAFDQLPGPTYVRGYLRSYAQFLDVVPQPLIDAYNDRPEAARRTEMAAPAPVRQATSSDAMVRFGTALIVVIVLGLAGLWWSGHDTSNLRPAMPEPATSSEGGARPAIVDAEREVAPEPPAEQSNETPLATAPSAETASDADTEVVPPPAASARAETPSATPEPPPLDPSVPLARLVLYMHEDSWADVRDAQQRRLLYETIPAGRVVTVEGVAPIRVFLGNVDGVTVEFNGQPYDPARHKRGEVARFTLGQPNG